MTRVSTNQILGNRGENLVSYLLSQYCLVRPVANGTDIGVDLFCETIIEDGRSAGHFWIQVKSKAKQTKKVKLDKGHVEYWIRQPVPVFIFIICADQNTNASNYEIRSINLIEQLIKNSNFKGKSRIFHSDDAITNARELKRFVSQTVPKTIARQKLTEGLIVPIRYKGTDEYVKTYDVVDSAKFINKILKNIGRSSSLLANEILKSRKGKEFGKQLKQLELILEAFSDWPNFDMPCTLAILQERVGKYQQAIINYQKAIDILNRDKNHEISDFAKTSQIVQIRVRISICQKQLLRHTVLE
jgi:tetratricopeptide (TPR) repeat protein